VFITQFAKTPALQYADVLLLCGAQEGPFQGGSIAAKLSQVFTLDVIYTEFFSRMGKKAEKNKKLTSAATAEKML
jgi:DNA-binding MurR/RpiR family transcriptional regulator